MRDPTPSTTLSSRWLLALCVGLPFVAAVAYLAFPPAEKKASSRSRVTGSLSLYITKKTANEVPRTIPIEEAGALPVRFGDGMQMEVRFNSPAHVYVVWLDSRGAVTPLYPWNDDDLTVKDLDEPPLREATQVFISPDALGTSWKFSREPGVETVLVLARHDPLPKELSLADVIGKPTQPRNFAPSFLAMDAVPSVRTVYVLPPDSRGEDEDFVALLRRLGQHFDMVRAVRFQHAE